MVVECASLLRRFANAKALWEGKCVHAQIIRFGFDRNRFLSNLLIQMYGNCGMLEDARAVFDKIRHPNVFSWTMMVQAYAQNGRVEVARSLFNLMPHRNVVSWNIMIAAYAQTGRVEDARVLFDGMPQRDIVSWNAMIAVYAQNGAVEIARSLFDKMPQRDVVSWNAMIAAYAQNGQGKECLQLFGLMQRKGVKPEKITLISILDACAGLGCLEEGKKCHASLVDSGVDSDVVVGNAIVNMYGKCGSLHDACSVFHRMPQRNVVSWTAQIAAYAQNKQGNEALEFFRQMELNGLKPDRITFISVLDACASLAAVADGKENHACIIESGFESDVVIGNALVNMYGRCGSLRDARSVFNRMPQRNVISWTAMIAACAQNGHAKEAIELFRQMQMKGMKPDKITFVNLLSGCSHAGLLEDGSHLFVSMKTNFSIMPLVEHYVCMTDLLGRAGMLDEAEGLVKNMPFEPDSAAWMTLLGACRIHGDVERAAHAAVHVFELDPQIAAPFVLLSNIYAAAGRWEDVAKLRKEMKSRNVNKWPGHSCIEVKNMDHKICCRRYITTTDEHTYGKPDVGGGICSERETTLHDVEQVKHMLSSHRQKCAIFSGLISTPSQTPLFITKEHWMCF